MGAAGSIEGGEARVKLYKQIKAEWDDIKDTADDELAAKLLSEKLGMTEEMFSAIIMSGSPTKAAKTHGFAVPDDAATVAADTEVAQATADAVEEGGEATEPASRWSRPITIGAIIFPSRTS